MSAALWLEEPGVHDLAAIVMDVIPPMGSPDAGVLVRRARPADVPAMLELLEEFARRGLVLPRSAAQIYRQVREFTLAVDDAGLVACAGLRVYNANLAEVCALAVSERRHGQGIGRQIVGTLVDEARSLEIRRVFALTLQPAFFCRAGFRPVPREAVPEKMEADRIEGIDRTGCRKITMVRDLAS